MRTVQTVINVVLLLTMLGQMVSGIILSRNVFAFLSISGKISMARSLHVFCRFWCFVLMSLHLGLHWNMILVRMQKAAGKADSGKKRFMAWMRAAITLYGLYAFVKNQFILYMLRLSSFAFFDFERPVLLYITEYLAIMGLFVFIAHYGVKGLLKLSGRRKKP